MVLVLFFGCFCCVLLVFIVQTSKGCFCVFFDVIVMVLDVFVVMLDVIVVVLIILLWFFKFY